MWLCWISFSLSEIQTILSFDFLPLPPSTLVSAPTALVTHYSYHTSGYALMTPSHLPGHGKRPETCWQRVLDHREVFFLCSFFFVVPHIFFDKLQTTRTRIKAQSMSLTCLGLSTTTSSTKDAAFRLIATCLGMFFFLFLIIYFYWLLLLPIAYVWAHLWQQQHHHQ